MWEKRRLSVVGLGLVVLLLISGDILGAAQPTEAAQDGFVPMG